MVAKATRGGEWGLGWGVANGGAREGDGGGGGIGGKFANLRTSGQKQLTEKTQRKQSAGRGGVRPPAEAPGRGGGPAEQLWASAHLRGDRGTGDGVRVAPPSGPLRGLAEDRGAGPPPPQTLRAGVTAHPAGSRALLGVKVSAAPCLASAPLPSAPHLLRPAGEVAGPAKATSRGPLRLTGAPPSSRPLSSLQVPPVS